MPSGGALISTEIEVPAGRLPSVAQTVPIVRATISRIVGTTPIDIFLLVIPVSSLQVELRLAKRYQERPQPVETPGNAYCMQSPPFLRIVYAKKPNPDQCQGNLG
jgi:hypothetical protein